MEAITDLFSAAFAEVVVILLGAGLTYLGTKVNGLIAVARKKDELGIIDSLTDYAVEFAEAELKGEKGIAKRNYAVDKALELLAGQGIKVSRDHVLAGIENGVNKLRNQQAKQ